MRRSDIKRRRSRSPHTPSMSPIEDPIARDLEHSALLWYDRYMTQGYRASEARRKALRHRSNEFPPLQRDTRRPRNMPQASTYARLVRRSRERSEGTRLITSSASITSVCRAAASVSYKVAILPADYPNAVLEHEQLTQLELAIMKEVAKGAAHKLVFDGVQHWPGMLIVFCANAFTEDWLVQAAPRLGEWPGQQLAACRGNDIPRPQRTVSMFLPRSQELSVATLLRLIDVQNECLHPALWTVMGRRNEGKGQLLTVAMDDESRQTVVRQGYRLRFGFGHVQVNGTRDRRLQFERHRRSRCRSRSSMRIDTTYS